MPVQEPTDAVIIESIEACFDRGWTDGLPVVPPTPSGLERILQGTARDPQEVVGILPPKRGVVTVEKVALNALMAGCKPAYLPVVLAAAEALCDPLFNIYACVMGTQGWAPLLVVNGPIRHEIDINCRGNVLGPGWRANATIGRAIRLLIRNVGGALPGELDRATLGHPGKYTYCIGEDEEHSPWEPLHVERGFARDASVVTVFSCRAPTQFGVPKGSAEMVLNLLVDGVRSLMHFVSHGEDVTLIFDEQQRGELVAAGYSKADVQRYVYEKTLRTAGEIRRAGFEKFLEDAGDVRDDEQVHLFHSMQAINIIAAGAGSRYSAFVPTYLSKPGDREPISRLVRDE